MVEVSGFRGLLATLSAGSLALDDVRAPEFCLVEDHRIVAYYAPFDYLNRLARVALAGVTPGPTQLRESYAIVRDALRAGQSDEQALHSAVPAAALEYRWRPDVPSGGVPAHRLRRIPRPDSPPRADVPRAAA